MKHNPHYLSSSTDESYHKAKIQAHYDKLCEIIDSKMCANKDIAMYFEDKQFKKYYYGRKKNGQGSL